MVTEIQFPQPYILGLKVEGKIEQANFVQMMQKLIPKIEGHQHFNLYIEIPRYEGFDPELILEGIKFAFQQLGNYLEKVDKLALVTDKGWLRFFTSLEYTIVPSIRQKSFSIDEIIEAKRWIAEPKEK